MGDNIILWVVIIITLIFSMQGWNDYDFFERYKFKVSGVLKKKQYERLLSSGFLHVGWGHLLFNMMTFYFFGKDLIYSAKVFLIIYFGSILAGSLMSLYFHRKNSQYSAVGASGGVSGLVYSIIVLAPQLELFIFPLPMPIPGWIFAIAYMCYSIFGMQNQWGNFGHSAHLGGAIFGLLATILLRPEVLFLHSLYVILMAIPIVYLIFNEIKER